GLHAAAKIIRAPGRAEVKVALDPLQHCRGGQLPVPPGVLQAQAEILLAAAGIQAVAAVLEAGRRRMVECQFDLPATAPILAVMAKPGLRALAITAVAAVLAVVEVLRVH